MGWPEIHRGKMDHPSFARGKTDWGKFRSVTLVLKKTTSENVYTYLLHYSVSSQKASILTVYLREKNSLLEVKTKAKIRNLNNQIPHLTQGTISESDKNTRKHQKQEPRGQPFPSR